MKHHIIQICYKTLSITRLDFLYFGTIMTLKIKIFQLFINTGKASPQNSLYPMQLLPLFYFFIRHSRVRTRIRQKTLGKKKYINNSGNSDEYSHLSEFEHGEAFKSGFQYHSMHHQVSRSTDQCTDTSQNSHIRKRNQKLRSREIHRFSPMLDNRGKNNHDRRIIQKGRNKSHRRQDTQLCFKHRCLSLRKQLLNHLSQCTRLTNTFTHQKQQSNGNHPFITKPFQHLLRSQNAGTQKQNHYRKKYHARTHLVCYQSRYHS